MAKEIYFFEDFLQNVADEYKRFVSQVQELLTTDGYIIKVEKKAIGFFVSYADSRTKKSMLNFLFRKNGLYIRMYATNCDKYADVLNQSPDEIVKQITKAKGFISSTLMVDGDTWVDTIVFETKEDMTAFETAAKKPSALAKEFYSYINFMAGGNKMLKLAVVNDFTKG